MYWKYNKKIWYLKQLNKNQISGDISLEVLKQKIEEGFIPVMSISRLWNCIEYYKVDKNIFSKYENLIEEFNSFQK